MRLTEYFSKYQVRTELGWLREQKSRPFGDEAYFCFFTTCIREVVGHAKGRC
ncbi:hypothetical protein JCM16418A_26420 [Paenibacillus pini]